MSINSTPKETPPQATAANPTCFGHNPEGYPIGKIFQSQRTQQYSAGPNLYDMMLPMMNKTSMPRIVTEDYEFPLFVPSPTVLLDKDAFKKITVQFCGVGAEIQRVKEMVRNSLLKTFKESKLPYNLTAEVLEKVLHNTLHEKCLQYVDPERIDHHPRHQNTVTVEIGLVLFFEMSDFGFFALYENQLGSPLINVSYFSVESEEFRCHKNFD